MFTIKNSVVQYACFAVLGFREAALNFREKFAAEDDYSTLIDLYGQGEAELIAEFETVGTICNEVYSTLLHVVPSAPRGLFEYEIPQKLGAAIASHLFESGDLMPWAMVIKTAKDLMIDYYKAGTDTPDQAVINSIADTFTTFENLIKN